MTHWHASCSLVRTEGSGDYFETFSIKVSDEGPLGAIAQAIGHLNELYRQIEGPQDSDPVTHTWQETLSDGRVVTYTNDPGPPIDTGDGNFMELPSPSHLPPLRTRHGHSGAPDLPCIYNANANLPQPCGGAYKDHPMPHPLGPDAGLNQLPPYSFDAQTQAKLMRSGKGWAGHQYTPGTDIGGTYCTYSEPGSIVVCNRGPLEHTS